MAEPRYKSRGTAKEIDKARADGTYKSSIDLDNLATPETIVDEVAVKMVEVNVDEAVAKMAEINAALSGTAPPKVKSTTPATKTYTADEVEALIAARVSAAIKAIAVEQVTDVKVSTPKVEATKEDVKPDVSKLVNEDKTVEESIASALAAGTTEVKTETHRHVKHSDEIESEIKAAIAKARVVGYAEEFMACFRKNNVSAPSNPGSWKNIFG